MPIHPEVQEGLDAYRRGDFHAAHTAWEHGAAHATGDRHGLLSALADLAAALERQRTGLTTGAGQLLDATRKRLDDLPSQSLGVDVDGLLAALPAEPAAALEAPPEVRAARAIPRWAVARFLVLVALVGLGFVAFRFTPLGEHLRESLDREHLLALRESLQARWWTAPLLVGVYAVLAPLGAPVSPLMLAGGAVFGTLAGTGLNFLGTFVGAAGSFFLARALGRDFVVHVAGHRLDRVERLATRRGFWPLVRIRFLPIPFPVVNYGAALAGVPASLFLSTTAVGLLPATLVFTYFASAMVDAVGGERAGIFVRLGLAGAGLLALSFIPNVLVALRRRRRRSGGRLIRLPGTDTGAREPAELRRSRTGVPRPGTASEGPGPELPDGGGPSARLTGIRPRAGSWRRSDRSQLGVSPAARGSPTRRRGLRGPATGRNPRTRPGRGHPTGRRRGRCGRARPLSPATIPACPRPPRPPPARWRSPTPSAGASSARRKPSARWPSPSPSTSAGSPRATSS